MISAPENIIRALAQAPETKIRNILLQALGYDSTLTSVTAEQRRAATVSLHQWFDDKDLAQGEIPI